MATVGQTLHTAIQALNPLSSASGSEARRLLAHVLERDSTWLVTYPETEITPTQQTQFETMLQRRLNGYPLPYLLGEWGFYHWDFRINEHVLIPRPETELLVEKAYTWSKKRSIPLRILDVGTGSGIIGVSMALLLPDAAVTAIDISSHALAVAQENAQRLGAKNIQFLESNLFINISEQYDLILANLPYIDTQEMHTLAVAQHEPHLALDGGVGGLELIEQLLAQSPAYLREHGAIGLEIGHGQGVATQALAHKVYPQAQSIVLLDLNQLERVVWIEI